MSRSFKRVGAMSGLSVLVFMLGACQQGDEPPASPRGAATVPREPPGPAHPDLSADDAASGAGPTPDGTPHYAGSLVEAVKRFQWRHGLEDPARLAEWVLRDQPEWTRERIDAAMHAERPTRVNLKEPLRVVLFYVTAQVDSEGVVHFVDSAAIDVRYGWTYDVNDHCIIHCDVHYIISINN